MSKSYNAQGTVLAGGACEVDMQPVNSMKWQILHMAVTCTGTSQSTCSVFVDTRYFCGTAVGNGDTADGAPLVVNANQSLRFVWAGATIGSICTVTILVEESSVG